MGAEDVVTGLLDVVLEVFMVLVMVVVGFEVVVGGFELEVDEDLAVEVGGFAVLREGSVSKARADSTAARTSFQRGIGSLKEGQYIY